jgi:hypothetical protein
LRPNGCQGGSFLAGSDGFVAAQYVMVNEIAAVVVEVVVEVKAVTTGVQLVHDHTIRCAEVERGICRTECARASMFKRAHNTKFWTTDCFWHKRAQRRAQRWEEGDCLADAVMVVHNDDTYLSG